jgi:hypothetical protein
MPSYMYLYTYDNGTRYRHNVQGGAIWCYPSVFPLLMQHFQIIKSW